MGGNSYIAPALFDFLKELRENNNRGWFQANRAHYESTVREPMLRFIADFAPRLHEINRNFVADPRPLGGSMFRIHRDTRFSRDKSPYKTHVGVQFRHASASDVHAPGFYLHLEPAEVFGACGIWRPEAPTLAAVGEAIAKNPERWRRALSGRGFKAQWRFDGESLRRPPRGFGPDHPFIEDLKRKDFVTVTDFSEKQACGPDFMRTFAERLRTAAPFMAFLTKAVGLRT